MEVSKGLKGKWAIILGASGEVGSTTALKMANEGVNLCLVYRERKSSLKVVNELQNELDKTGVEILHYNLDALKLENRQAIIEELTSKSQNQVCWSTLLLKEHSKV
ncbi:MAG: SDR family NAD(P)-dependent oxidoreductase [Flavobacteriales bacterium]